MPENMKIINTKMIQQKAEDWTEEKDLREKENKKWARKGKDVALSMIAVSHSTAATNTSQRIYRWRYFSIVVSAADTLCRCRILNCSDLVHNAHW